MKLFLKYTLSLFLFWWLMFFIHRIFFTLYQFPLEKKIEQKADIYKAFYKGFALDNATAIMLLLLPLLLFVFHFIFKKQWLATAIKYILLLLIFLYTCVSLADSGLYREWNAKINFQALAHFKNPTEVFKTVSILHQLLFVFLVSSFVFFFYTIYKRKIHSLLFQINYNATQSKRAFISLSYFLITATVGFLLIRGGVSDVPMNQSIAYFSPSVLANDIAINPLYNLLQDATVQNNIPNESAYKYRSTQEARKLIADDFFIEKDTTISILQTTKPNIVYIILESWSTDNISTLGGIDGVTPCFNQLCNEGLLFTKAYSNAYVSDQGVPCNLSAAPSVSRIVVANQPAQVHKISCISETLKPLGYSSSFLYGGDLVFGNLRGYLLEKKFDEIIDVKNLSQYPKGRLGVHDEFLFPYLLQKINSQKQPFLQCYFTTSTHMPYDYPAMKNQWLSDPNDPEKKYTESTFYSDYHLGKFFDEAKKQSWYKNTLFVLVSDHSRNTIKQHSPESPEHQHIPLLLVGGALKPDWQGKKWTKIVSQLDIVSTLLHQMKVDSKPYKWSRNMLNPFTKSSAYYIVYGACGYINDSGFVGSYQPNNSIKHSNNLNSNLIKKLNDKALSFQQLVYELYQ